MAKNQSMSKETTPTIRCAIYTRKSSEEGLDQEFNSLDAQRESAEAFIASQKAQGWVCLPEQYNDGGFSGGSMERPALDRMLRDIDDGNIDCVVVYKVDRLSRSLMDFSRILETFEKQEVSFVSVTQQFNTTHSMGRLTLNILLSFAQFEREIIGERIRDKIAALKRKGKWTGGVPVLGYDVDRSESSPKLVINAEEALRIRAIFDLYLVKGSLLPVVHELARKDWRNKKRITKKGKLIGDKPFDKSTLYNHLTNPVYIGKITHKDEVFEGEHDAIIDLEVFEQVQKMLMENGRGGGAESRNKYGALLRGILRCKSCDRSMTHTFTTTRGQQKTQYRYYRCVGAIKSGSCTCPSGTLPAAEIERVVIDEIRGIAKDKASLNQVLVESQLKIEHELKAKQTEHDDLTKELKRHHRELKRLATDSNNSNGTVDRMADLQDRISSGEQRLPIIKSHIAELEHETITPAEAKQVFADFDTIWANLIPREQSRLLQLLISTVEYDAEHGSISVTFRPTSIRALVSKSSKEAA
tara:strand:- start:12332 stop:13912 length:1581 start_codon:yes stop_codon:yes gene_type:complete